MLLGVLLAAMWSFLWFVVAPRTGNVTAEAEGQAMIAINDVSAELHSYADARGGAYPSKLEELGPDVRQAAQMAQSDGYQLEYTPGPAEGDGSIHNYSLEARAGNYGYRNFYVDISGVVRATKGKSRGHQLRSSGALERSTSCAPGSRFGDEWKIADK